MCGSALGRGVNSRGLRQVIIAVGCIVSGWSLRGLTCPRCCECGQGRDVAPSTVSRITFAPSASDPTRIHSSSRDTRGQSAQRQPHTRTRHAEAATSPDSDPGALKINTSATQATRAVVTIHPSCLVGLKWSDPTDRGELFRWSGQPPHKPRPVSGAIQTPVPVHAMLGPDLWVAPPHDGMLSGWLSAKSMPHLLGHPDYVRWDNVPALVGSESKTSGLAFVCPLAARRGTRYLQAQGSPDIDLLLTLPQRSPQFPWVVPAFYTAASDPIGMSTCNGQATRKYKPPSAADKSACNKMVSLLATRNDILFSSVDRLQHNLCDDDSSGMLPGSTFPVFQHNTCWLATAPDSEIAAAGRRRYLLSFSGRNHDGWFGSSHVRSSLNRSHTRWQTTEGRGRSDIFFAWQQPTAYASERASVDYHGVLRNSTYGAVLHGDQRWSYRLLEVVCSGAIPLIMSDGLSLPFEHTVPWDRIALRHPENAADDFGGLVRALEGRFDVAVMRAELRKFAQRCLSTEEDRIRCFVESLQSAVRRQLFASPSVSAARRINGTGRHCPGEAPG